MLFKYLKLTLTYKKVSNNEFLQRHIMKFIIKRNNIIIKFDIFNLLKFKQKNLYFKSKKYFKHIYHTKILLFRFPVFFISILPKFGALQSNLR